jgi:hypothetical protein
MFTIILIITIIILVIVIVILAYILHKRNQRENFMLGSIKDNQAPYYQCLSDCENEDPSKRLSGYANLSCASFCDTKYSDAKKLDVNMNNVKGESYDINYMKETNKNQDLFDDDQECYHQVNNSCRQDCTYSHLSIQECMDQCFDVNRTNCQNGSWVFKR